MSKGENKKNSRRLLVEGEADRGFFEALLREVQLKNVWVGPPSDFDASGNGKGNAIRLIPAMIDLFEQEGQLERLALVMDADYSDISGGGYKATRDKLDEIFGNKNYKRSAPGKNYNGLLYVRKEYPSVPVWIMPNNRDDGYLEKLISSSVVSSDASLFNAAVRAVNSIHAPKFPPYHKAKAEVATCLAWQETPGEPLRSAVGNKLLNLNTSPLANLCDWLKMAFS